MAYAIMRSKKLSSMGCVGGALKHCYRERETDNADPSRTRENEHWGARSTDEAMGKLRELLPEKRRKDAVLAVEYLLTASPEWWSSASQVEQSAFFARSKQWLADKYGADRIVTATIHRDEATPHLSAFVVPLTQDGRLSAKEFIGGRQKMRDDQTSYAERVSDLGLERGIEGSRAKHQRVKSYYAAIQREPRHFSISPQTLEPRQYKPEGIAERLGLVKRMESQEEVAKRLTKVIQEAYAPAVQAAAGAHQERQKAQKTQETARHLRDRLKPVLDVLQPLNREMQAKVAGIIRGVGEKALAVQKEQQRQKDAQRQQERGGYSR